MTGPGPAWGPAPTLEELRELVACRVVYLESSVAEGKRNPAPMRARAARLVMVLPSVGHRPPRVILELEDSAGFLYEQEAEADRVRFPAGHLEEHPAAARAWPRWWLRISSGERYELLEVDGAPSSLWGWDGDCVIRGPLFSDAAPRDLRLPVRYVLRNFTLTDPPPAILEDSDPRRRAP